MAIPRQLNEPGQVMVETMSSLTSRVASQGKIVDLAQAPRWLRYDVALGTAVIEAADLSRYSRDDMASLPLSSTADQSPASQYFLSKVPELQVPRVLLHTSRAKCGTGPLCRPRSLI